ncbi:hypothetical protein [Microcoleus vaginatus]|uniref:hypothetical protein n=1 Tax=Microcoleus vaginatus TaxID=119532 RepID=UPI00403FAF92
MRGRATKFRVRAQHWLDRNHPRAAPPGTKPLLGLSCRGDNKKPLPSLAGVENYQGASTNVLSIAWFVGCHP